MLPLFVSAGDIAQTALQSVSHGANPIGPRGTWNSTSCPREYSLETTSMSKLTFSELYGGIDGKLPILLKNEFVSSQSNHC